MSKKNELLFNELYEKTKNYGRVRFINLLMTKEKENQELKKQLEEKNKPQIFIDTQDMEERYAEGLYQDYLEEENKKYKNQQKEFIEYLEDNIKKYEDKLKECPFMTGMLTLPISFWKDELSKYKEIIGVSNE